MSSTHPDKNDFFSHCLEAAHQGQRLWNFDRTGRVPAEVSQESMKIGYYFMDYISHSEAETEEIGENLGRTLPPGTVLAYRGDLGMGKTAFTRGLARGLGCRESVTSPTFTIVNEYEGALPLFHFDMYRLGDADDLFDIGWEDYLDRGGVCAVEWSERVTEALPEETLWVTLSRVDGHDDWRHITIEGGTV